MWGGWHAGHRGDFNIPKEERVNKSVSSDCIRDRRADCDVHCCCFRFATLTYLERFMNMRELAWSWESRLLHDPCAFYKNNIEE